MYGSQLLDEASVADFAGYGMHFITRDDPSAGNYFWYMDPTAGLVASTGLIGQMTASKKIDRLQLTAIHHLVDELNLEYGATVGYSAKSSTVLRVLRGAADVMMAKGYNPAALGPALGIYGSLGRDNRAGRNVMSCIKVANQLVDLDINERVFYDLLDNLRGPKCLERTAAAYRFVTDLTLPPTNMTLVRELFAA